MKPFNYLFIERLLHTFKSFAALLVIVLLAIGLTCLLLQFPIPLKIVFVFILCLIVIGPIYLWLHWQFIYPYKHYLQCKEDFKTLDRLQLLNTIPIESASTFSHQPPVVLIKQTKRNLETLSLVVPNLEEYISVEGDKVNNNDSLLNIGPAAYHFANAEFDGVAFIEKQK